MWFSDKMWPYATGMDIITYRFVQVPGGLFNYLTVTENYVNIKHWSFSKKYHAQYPNFGDFLKG